MLANEKWNLVYVFVNDDSLRSLTMAKYRSYYTMVTFVNVNIRMYNFDDVQCTVIPSVAYGFVTGMNLQLC